MHKEEGVCYEIMIDLITSIIEKHINNDGDGKSLDVGKLAI